MTDSHNQSFFGQNAAIFVRSSSKYDDFIFIQCIKRKGGNVWERPSQGEGKNIKISLGEMVMIVKVLNKERDSWSTYHRYKDDNTQISFNWQGEVLWANIGEYSKKLQSPNIEILTLLLNHLIKEKIEFATGGNHQNNNSFNSKTNENPNHNKNTHRESSSEDLLNKSKEEKEETSLTPSSPKMSFPNGQSSKNSSNIIVKEEVFHSPSSSIENTNPSASNNSETPIDAQTVNGKIRRATAKALLIRFDDGIEAWIPKSTIHSEFSTENKNFQPFLIQSWVLEKNNAAT